MIFEFKKENDKYLMTLEKFKYSNNIEYVLEFTNKKTLMTQTLISEDKEPINFKNYDLNIISDKLNKWKIPKRKIYDKGILYVKEQQQ